MDGITTMDYYGNVMEISWEYHLVGGIPTPLQNDGVRQWEG